MPDGKISKIDVKAAKTEPVKNLMQKWFSMADAERQYMFDHCLVRTKRHILIVLFSSDRLEGNA